jgi:hypothetical protein
MVQPTTRKQPAADQPPVTLPPQLSTLGELRASGHQLRTVKQELRHNLLERMRAGEDAFPGIIGFGQTVLPHLERAIIAGHDVILLGERGQGKTRLIRTLTGLLDDWTPVVAGCEINDHPFAPVCARCQRLLIQQGDDLAIAWRPRTDRYGEKLATPATSTRSRLPRAGRSATRRQSTSACCHGPTAASSASTNCPISPSGSRSHC